MKKIGIAFLVLSVLIAGTGLAADDFSLHVDYNVPVGNELVDPNLAFGAMYQFWGIFTISGTMYTDIVYGADNILNINRIQPLGLFSGGFGLQIPLGGFYLAMDWQKFYTGTISNAGIYNYCDSYKFGLSMDVNEYVGVEVYTRRLYAFTDRSVDDDAIRITSTDETVQTIGAGLVLSF